MWDAMPSPNRSPRRGHPSSASGTPPRSPNPRGRVGSTAGDGNTSSDGPTDAASSSRPRVDTKSPVTRATLAYTPVADLVASPLAPLAFDLKKLASQAPTRNKDTAIVALSNQLDAMRARLREAEEAAGSPAPVSSSVSRRGTDTAAGNTYRATPPASPPTTWRTARDTTACSIQPNTKTFRNLDAKRRRAGDARRGRYE